MDLNSIQGDMKKTFFDRPEGKTGMFFLALIIAGGGFLLYKFLPFIITLFENLIYAGLMFAGIGLVVFLFLNPQFRATVWAFYKIIMKSLTGFVVQLDPLAIIDGYVDDLKKSLGKMSQQMGKLKGQMSDLKRVIDDNTDTIKTNMKLAQKANEKGGKKSMVTLKTRKAGRMKDSNIRLETLYKKMANLYNVLTKMHEVSAFVIEDLEDEVQVSKQERKAILAGHSAFKSAMSAVNGNPDQRAMFEQAMENIQSDVANKVGEMERFMEMSSGFIDNMDVQNGVFEEEGLAMLEEFEANGFDFIDKSFSKTSSGKDVNSSMSFDMNKDINSENSYLQNVQMGQPGTPGANAGKYF